jgi:hypothetical protein
VRIYVSTEGREDNAKGDMVTSSCGLFYCAASNVDYTASNGRINRRMKWAGHEARMDR